MACDTRKPLLAGNARKAHETFWTFGTRQAVQAVMTRMTAHSARAWMTGRAADGDLLFNVLIELVDAGDIAIKTVNLKEVGFSSEDAGCNNGNAPCV